MKPEDQADPDNPELTEAEIATAKPATEVWPRRLITQLSESSRREKKAFKVSPASRRRSRGDVVRLIAAGTELEPGKVREVMDVLNDIIAADLGKEGCGEFNFHGLVKLKTVSKPATKARKGRNLFTGEEIMSKAKPASRKIRVRALRASREKSRTAG